MVYQKAVLGVGVKRLSIDIGGTFTDLLYWDETSGTQCLHTRPTTPEDPSEGGIRGILELCHKAGVAPSEIGVILHGTTIATNALVEHSGACVGMITTHGFRDILHIGRKNRPLNFSHAQDVPRQTRPLVARRYRIGVPERIRAPDGAIEVPLDESAVRAAVLQLRASGEVEAIAVGCLFAFMNPAHEQRILEIVREEWPDVFACASHEVMPLYREYERFSTTALNAYLGPLTSRYIKRFSDALARIGYAGQMSLMTSAGGLVSADDGASAPVSLLLSGPVGALTAGIETGRNLGQRNVITLDVGGTSADIGIAPDGELRMKHLLDTQVNGYDVMMPMCDIDTIGAGGGSIAWIDEGGMFRVGPQSAGASPGPACYGQGGSEATVTDAIVALGWYRPAALRASGLEIDRQAALDVLDQRIAQPLGLGVTEAAAGIVRVAVHNMVEAIRLNSVARGLDPREFCLVAYGGAGAAFAAAVAQELSIPEVIVPPSAGVGAARGLLATDLRYQRQATFWQCLRSAALADITATAERLRTELEQRLIRHAKDTDAILIHYEVDCRYEGQGYELRVRAPDRPIDAQWCEEVIMRFHQLHRRLYHRNFPDRKVMAVNLSATGMIPTPSPGEAPRRVSEYANEESHFARAFFPEGNQTIEKQTQFLHRDALPAGTVIEGPAVVEQNDTTTVAPPGTTLNVLEDGHLRITMGHEA